MQIDKRIAQLAENILENSVQLKKGEKIYIEAFGASTKDFFNEFIKETIKLGAVPFYFYNDASFEKSLIEGASEKQIEDYTAIHKRLMEDADCYVAVRGYDDAFALSDVSAKNMDMFGKIFQEQVHMRTRLPKTRWCVLRWPNTSMAAMSRMSLKQFEDFYFDACLLDYRKWARPCCL